MNVLAGMTYSALPTGVIDICRRATRDNPDAVVTIVDVDGFFRYVSPSIREVAGYTPMEQVGRHYADFYDKLDAIHFGLAAQDALINGQSISVTRYVRTKNGAYQRMRGIRYRVTDKASGEPFVLSIGYPIDR